MDIVTKRVRLLAAWRLPFPWLIMVTGFAGSILGALLVALGFALHHSLASIAGNATEGAICLIGGYVGRRELRRPGRQPRRP